MSILDEIRESIRRADQYLPAPSDEQAPKDAERLADLFSDVEPQPYIVPIQRFVGLPVFSDGEIEK